MDSIAGHVVASAFDVVVETDITDVLVVNTALREIQCELFIWHHALAAVGARVVSWGWCWGWTAAT